MSSTSIEVTSVTTPFGKLHVQKWTPLNLIKDIPLVLLHDSLGCVDLWRDFPEQLAETLNRPVIAYDRLGFGQSDARDELPELDFIEQEASLYFPHIKEQLGIKEFILFGYSVGGAMAVNIAARDKGCIALITMSAQAFVEERTLDGILEAKQFFEQPGQSEKLQKWHGEKASWVLNAWTKVWTAPEFRGWSLNECIIHVTCPVLVIHGDKDEYGSKAFPEFIAGKVMGKSEMLLLENCGHMPQKTHPELVINKTTEFLSNQLIA